MHKHLLDSKRVSALKAYLDPIASRYESAAFIQDDPISIPHGFSERDDREIIGLFAALLAWGRRDVMLRKLGELCERMSFKPASFVHNYRSSRDRDKIEGFVHRTFNAADLDGILISLNKMLEGRSLEEAFSEGMDPDDPVRSGIESFSQRLYNGVPGRPQRIKQHIARPSTGSACKRFNMYLRWMVRKGPVDLGLWDIIRADELHLPLDVHSGTQARAMGLLERRSNDWKSVDILTENCRAMDRDDPCKYDFALFGAGAAGEILTIPESY